MPWLCPSACPDGLRVPIRPGTSYRRRVLGGPVTGATPAKGGELPAWLLQLWELLRFDLSRFFHPVRRSVLGLDLNSLACA